MFTFLWLVSKVNLDIKKNMIFLKARSMLTVIRATNIKVNVTRQTH